MLSVSIFLLQGDTRNGDMFLAFGQKRDFLGNCYRLVHSLARIGGLHTLD